MTPRHPVMFRPGESGVARRWPPQSKMASMAGCGRGFPLHDAGADVRRFRLKTCTGIKMQASRRGFYVLCQKSTGIIFGGQAAFLAQEKDK